MLLWTLDSVLSTLDSRLFSTSCHFPFLADRAAFLHFLDVLDGVRDFASGAVHVHFYFADLFGGLNGEIREVAHEAACRYDKAVHDIAHPVRLRVNRFPHPLQEALQLGRAPV